MYYLYDVNGYREDIGQSGIIDIFDKIGAENKLKTFSSFLDLGFTIEIDEVIKELNSIDWSDAGEISDVVNILVKGLSESEEIAILSDGTFEK